MELNNELVEDLIVTILEYILCSFETVDCDSELTGSSVLVAALVASFLPLDWSLSVSVAGYLTLE